MALVAHLATLKSSVPFLHFFDGFRTSHEIQKIDEIDYEDMAKLLRLRRSPRIPRPRAESGSSDPQRGTAQNPDIYFQGREAANKYYNAVPAIVEEVMDEVGELTGRQLSSLFDYVGAPDAEYVIVVDGLRLRTLRPRLSTKLNEMGEKVGLVKRSPVSSVLQHKRFVDAIPATCKTHRRARPHQGARLPGRAALPRRLRRPR